MIMENSIGKAKIDWSQADWILQDVVLASQFGCTREAARQARVKHGNGVIPDRLRKRTGETIATHLAAMNTAEMTLDQLSEAVGCKEQYVAVVLKSLGKTFKCRPRGNAKYNWEKIFNIWRKKTDQELADIVGAKNPAVVAQWRNRHGYRKMDIHHKKLLTIRIQKQKKTESSVQEKVPEPSLDNQQ
jgi:hypothetical protein